MSRCLLILVTAAFLLPVCSCVVADSTDVESITRSSEQFAVKYPDLSPAYYGRVISVEENIARGKRLYNQFYDTKLHENKIDYETRRRALEIFKSAIEEVMKIHRQSRADSVMPLKGRVSTYMQDLLREVERGPGTQSPDMNK